MASENAISTSPVPRRKLWFGLTATAAAWLTLGFTDILILWRACANPEVYGSEGPHPGARIISFVIAAALFVLALTAGVTSYWNWRALTHQQHLLEANAPDPQEFVALLGIIVSVTLGMGIVWLSIPPLLIQLCERAK
jgi:hypothetical protein